MPNHANARYYLGLALQKRGDLQAAIAELRTAVRLAPDMVEPAHALGLALPER